MNQFKTAAIPLIICLALDLCCVAPVSGVDMPRASRPYCGIYSVVSAAHAVGVDASFEELIRSERFHSTHGSTIRDIELACETLRLNTSAYENLSAERLLMIDSPVILHLHDKYDPTGVGHWVVYLGFDGERARIYDSAEGLFECEFGAVLRRWSGVAVVIDSENGGELSQKIGLVTPSFFVLALSLCAAVFVVVQRNFALTHSIRGRFLQLLVVFLCSGLSGVFYHWILPLGIFKNEVATSSITAEHFHERIREAELSLLQATDQNSVGSRLLLVDARSSTDFAKQNIAGSINIPGDWDSWRVAEAVSRVPLDTFVVVVFCRDSRCTWSNRVALHFAHRGQDVRVFSAGFSAILTALQRN